MTRTLVFCTSYATSPRAWQERWRRWISYVTSSPLLFDEAWIVDDCSPCLPDWPDVELLDAEAHSKPTSVVSLHRFRERLGQHNAIGPFPGWYRSFAYAVTHAISLGFDRIIHIESDAFLLSPRAFQLFNQFPGGWMSLWCPLYKWPESTLQVIAGPSLKAANDFFSAPYSEHCASIGAIESKIPFTHVEKRLIGDRYGEIADRVPFEADFVSQVRWGRSKEYFWWLTPEDIFAGDLNMPTANEVSERYKIEVEETTHKGVDYRAFLKFIDETLQPNAYLEIGTHEGEAVEQFSCQAVCIDPSFVIKRNVVKKKPSVHFFQLASDEFFEKYNPCNFVGDIDVAFLDGLHLYEALLRDFANVERHCHSNTLVAIHDCLPLNFRMTSRVHGSGPAEEDEKTRGFWTGDVWKVVPILKELRPSMTMVYVDCPPTGLVLCKGLTAGKTFLADEVADAVQRYSRVTLEDFGLKALWSLCPLLSSRAILDDALIFGRYFRLHGSKSRGPLVIA